MKIIFLNIWGGTMFEPLMKFIKESAPSTDFFCFQEVFDSDKRVDLAPEFAGFRSDIFKDLKRGLAGFDGSLALTNVLNIGGIKVDVGLAIFSKKGIEIDSEGDLIVYVNDLEEKPLERIKNLQYFRFVHGGKKITLCNFHGAAYPWNKLDSDGRLGQSRQIAEFLTLEKGEKILGGDFNLMPQTESVKIIESAGMKDLIKSFNIASTRSDLNYEKYKSSKVQLHFADYVFTSPGIDVRSFEVPRLNISDHLPLILQFD
jgi:hypothetical protein